MAQNRTLPGEDLAITFAKNIVKIRYADIPANAVEVTKKHILDHLATTLGGSDKPGAKDIVELFSEWGGKLEATILVWGYKVPAHHAAYYRPYPVLPAGPV